METEENNDESIGDVVNRIFEQLSKIKIEISMSKKGDEEEEEDGN